MNHPTRRHFLAATLGAAISTLCAEEKRPRRILLRSSWQTVNIGDIAHTPGVLTLLEKHFPEAEVRLWPSSVADGVEEILRARFPKLIILKDAESRKTAFAECDFMLHGSGSGFVARNDVVQIGRAHV